MARKTLKCGEPSEDAIQEAVFQWIKLNPEITDLCIHVPNEGSRNPRYGAKLKRMGMTAGVSDILITMARQGYHGAWIELKSKNGKLSFCQRRFLKTQKDQGYFTEVCYSVEEAIDTIEWYCYGS